MIKSIARVPSAKDAQELTGMNCNFYKALVCYGSMSSLEAWGWLSECGNNFVRECDGSKCGHDKFIVVEVST